MKFTISAIVAAIFAVTTTLVIVIILEILLIKIVIQIHRHKNANDTFESNRAKATQAQLDQILIQETSLQKIVYLDEEYKDINLIPTTNPFPNHTETLIHFSIHQDNDLQVVFHNHVQLPLSLMPVLDRTFLPSRTWHLENVYDTELMPE